MAARNSDVVYRFGRFVLDLRRGVLLDAGAERALRPKSFALLRHFVENRDRLIDRDEIMRAIWPDTFVTEDSVTQCVREIRRALGEAGQGILQTMNRRGYVFAIGSDRNFSTSEHEAQAELADLPVPEPPLAPPTARPLVIVMPFETIGGDPEEGYFADGLTADLVTDLTRFQDLRVTSPPRSTGMVFATDRNDFKERVVSPAQYVLRGSVRRAIGRLRVTVRLSDVNTEVNLWAERFDRPLEDLFKVQEELANGIAALVDQQVGRERLRRLLRHPPTSLDAYDLYLQGRALHDRTTEPDTLLARQLFDRAIAVDPDYAPAHAWQAYTVQRGFTFGWGVPRGRAALDVALGFADRAVALEPASALPLIRRALVLALLGRHDEAMEVAARAARTNPCDAACRASYGEVLSMSGLHQAGIAELRVALSLDPFHPPFWWGTTGRALLLADQPEDALMELRRCIARAPDYRPCHSSMVVACVETGRMEEARVAADEILRLRPGFVISNYDGVFGFRREADTARFLNAFREAGIPDR